MTIVPSRRGTRQICITVRRNRQCEFFSIRTQVFCNRFRIRIGDLLGINYLYCNVSRVAEIVRRNDGTHICCSRHERFIGGSQRSQV